MSSQHTQAPKPEVYVANESDLREILKAKGWGETGKHCRRGHGAVGTHSGALSSTWEVGEPRKEKKASQLRKFS